MHAFTGNDKMKYVSYVLSVVLFLSCTPVSDETVTILLSNNGQKGNETVSLPKPAIVRTVEDKPDDVFYNLALVRKHNAINSVSFSIDGSKIVTSGGGAKIVEWDLESGEHKDILNLKKEQFLGSAIFSYDGKYLIYAAANNQVMAIDLKNKREILFSFNGKKVVNLDYLKGVVAIARFDASVQLWDIEKELSQNLFKIAGTATHVIFFPNKKNKALLVTPAVTTAVHYWDGKQGDMQFETGPPLERPFIRDIDINHQGLIAITFRKKIRIFKLAINKQKVKVKKQHDIDIGYEITVLKFRDNNSIVFGGAKGVIGIIDVNKKKVLQKSCLFEGYPRYNDGTIVNEGDIYSFDISPDGQTVAVGMVDGALLLFNLNTKTKKWLNQPSSRYRLSLDNSCSSLK